MSAEPREHQSPEALLARFGRRFDAALGRDEERAAADLATSLRQGLSWEVAVGSGGEVLVHLGDSVRPVVRCGPDHLACGSPVDLLVRRDSVVLTVLERGRGPAFSRDVLCHAARPWASRGALVEVAATQSWTGKLVQIGAEYLTLTGPQSRRLVPMPLVQSIRLVPGG